MKTQKIEFIKGDCLTLLKDVPDNSIDLVVTSPPYNIGKDYGENFDDRASVEDYHEFLRLCCVEMFRVIKPNRSMFVNICDVGVSNRDAEGTHRIGERGNFYVIPNHVVVINSILPLDRAQYLNPIIWQKPSNHTSQFGANARFCGSYPFPANCHIPSEIEYILHFRKNGIFEKVEKSIKELSRVSRERWMELSGQIWTFNGVSKMKDHPAQFPLELPARLVEGWSFYGDTVLDPFAGLGTTAVACKKLGRNFVGMELNDKYIKLAKIRVDECSI